MTVTALRKQPPDDMSFADWVRTTRAQTGYSVREVAARSRDKNGEKQVSHGLVSLVENGQHKGNFDDRTLRGFARGLGVPVGEVYRRAKMRQPSQMRRLPAEARYIPDAQWSVLHELIRELGRSAKVGLTQTTGQKVCGYAAA